MINPAEDCNAVDGDRLPYQAISSAGHQSSDTRYELERHIKAGTFPSDFDETARLLLAALEIESPSNAVVEWMSRTSMELTRNVQHRRAE